ncbi:MAG: HAMP domain-containing protein [Acidobacteria bacterium]|nr:HAMP domain-containing protein [Acidobacteriota bacterium]
MSGNPSESSQKELRSRRLRIVGLIIVVAVYIAALIVVPRSRLAFGAVSLQAMTALNLTLILVMQFVLGRNVIKLYVERRRQKPGSQFSTRVVVTYIGMALIPTVLLFIVATSLIRTAVDTWFSTETEQIVRRAREVSDLAQEDQARELQRAARLIADEISEGRIGTLESESWDLLRVDFLEPRSEQLALDAIVAYDGTNLLLEPVFDEDGPHADVFRRLPTLPTTRALAEEESQGGGQTFAPLPENHPLYVPRAQIVGALEGQPFRLSNEIGDGARLLRAGEPIFDPVDRDVTTGVVVVGRIVTDALIAEVGAIENLYDSFMSGLAEKDPILSNYQLTFLLMTLLIVFSALWVGMYLARGVTVPIQKLAEGTRAVAAGDLSYQVEVDAQDELGTLVESFNQMTRDLRAGQENLRQSRDRLQATNTELDERRRYMEAMLANIGTGVISLNAEGEISTFNRAAARMLAMDASEAIGHRFENVLSNEAFADLSSLMERAKTRRAPLEDELSLDVNGSRLTVAAHCSILRDNAGAYIGTVVVLDDLTELITAQKTAAWREVARRIAHEIRNPLTPIQLSAQRIARRYRRAAGAEGQYDVIEEGTRTILQEVDTLKGLVSEFSRYARMPTVSLVPANLQEIVENGLLACASMHEGIAVERDFSPHIPIIDADPDQLKRAFTNLFDNAVEAMEGEGTLRVSTSYDSDLQTVRIEVADTGPGIEPEDKDRLFLPYFSRKHGGTGLGLAIVHQIVADHSGYVRVSDNQPRGTVISIELPC